MTSELLPTTSGATTLPGHASDAIRGMVQNILASALLTRPDHVYLISAWVSDVEVLDNSAGRFRALLPDLPETGIRLSEVLCELARGGSDVKVICWDSDHNNTFRDRLVTRGSSLPIDIRMAEHQHNKMLIIENLAAMTGSMNFTWYGFNKNGEDLVLERETKQVAGRLAYARRAWEDAG